jgi:hypothetical protein
MIADIGFGRGDRVGPEPKAVATEPDPERIANGWELRFVVEALRAESLVTLYRSLGYEACADPLRPELLPADCHDCRVAIALGFRAIYTRRTIARIAAP